MKVRGAAVATALAGILATGCGGDGADGGAERTTDDRTGDVALPPSANAPRASLPGRSPDTLRPEADTMVVDPLAEPAPAPGRRRSPEEFDLGAVVAAYQRYYREEYVEQGSDVRGRVDPGLVEDAKRRVALDWGYVDVGAWRSMLADMTADQRTVLSNRIGAADETLSRELHGPDAPEIP